MYWEESVLMDIVCIFFTFMLSAGKDMEITHGEIWAQPSPCFSYIEKLHGKGNQRALVP